MLESLIITAMGSMGIESSEIALNTGKMFILIVPKTLAFQFPIPVLSLWRS